MGAGYRAVKQKRRDELLHVAELVDAFRLFPRLFLFSCFCWCVWVTYQILVFYFTLPSAERTTQVTAFATGVQTAVLGFAKLVYGDYRKDGRKWGQPVPVSTTTATVQTTTTTPQPMGHATP